MKVLSLNPNCFRVWIFVCLSLKHVRFCCSSTLQIPPLGARRSWKSMTTWSCNHFTFSAIFICITLLIVCRVLCLEEKPLLFKWGCSETKLYFSVALCSVFGTPYWLRFRICQRDFEFNRCYLRVAFFFY